MKKSILLTLAMVVSMGMMAVPARRAWHEKTQPDGTTIKVMMVGDEFYHYYINENGERIALGEDGWWQAISDGTIGDGAISDGTISEGAISEGARRVASQPLKAIGMPTTVKKGLVILVNFQDVKFAAKNTRQEMDSMLNAQNYTYNGSYGSAREYFRAQSDGAYVPDFEVVGPVTVSQKMSYYGQNTSGESTDRYPGQMVIEACLLANDEVDFTQFDADNDGNIDLVYIIHAGQGENEVYTANLLWPKRWAVSSSNATSTYYNKRVVDGKKIYDFAYSNELDWNGNRSGIGTFCHEFGHVLGLPDFYDTNYSTNYLQGYTPGSWDIMDLGSQNDDGKCPPNYSPWEKMFMGWSTPEVLSDSAVITMGTGYDEFYQLNSNLSEAAWSSTTTQYYIENRQKNGWDKGLPYHGMIVWKVDYNASSWSSNKPNNTANKPRYTIVSAKDAPHVYPYRTDSEGYLLWNEGNLTPFPGSKNVSSVELIEGYPLKDIAENDGEITFTFIEKPYEPVVPTGVEEARGDEARGKEVKKVMENGRLMIIRNGIKYDIRGQRTGNR